MAQQKVASRFNAAVEIDCGEQGLECIDEQTLLGAASGGFLAAAQLQIAAKIETMCATASK